MPTRFWLLPVVVGCASALPACGSAGRPSRTAASASVLKYAQCMRGHGFPNYPDPTFPPGGGVENLIPSSVDANSPAFQSAAKACGGG